MLKFAVGWIKTRSMLDTNHKILFQNSSQLDNLQSSSVDLVVTSPPYPMIEMWDGIMSNQNPQIKDSLKSNPAEAFELMHIEIDKVWKHCYRVLKDGGYMCINIGDATRTINGEFQLYNNHARIVSYCSSIGFTNLPNIIWRKQTNAPNKFMGSGMLPCGAYVTLEHEWVLIFRKGGKRAYKYEADKELRKSSSFFWEERNVWFSDLWELKGVKQTISNSKTRERSASFPLAIPYRLINMYSQKYDTILDPFFGLGTTTIAAMLAERNSVGIEIDSLLRQSIIANLNSIEGEVINRLIYDRFQSHLAFIKQREEAGKEVKYFNEAMQCKVMTKQELDMTLHYLKTINVNTEKELSYSCVYDSSMSVDNFRYSGIGGLFAN